MEEELGSVLALLVPLTLTLDVADGLDDPVADGLTLREPVPLALLVADGLALLVPVPLALLVADGLALREPVPLALLEPLAVPG